MTCNCGQGCENDGHKGTWIGYKDCKCKWCKKASIGTRAVMKKINKRLMK